MNRMTLTPVDSPDDLDALLGRFFKGEMPAPFPAFQPPAGARPFPLPRQNPPPAARRLGSRFSLAASVAVLVAAGWMAGDPAAPADRVTLPPAGEGSASSTNRLAPGLPRPEPADADLPVTLEQRDRTGLKVEVPGPRPNP
jgi:hypothetical protein